MTEAEKDRKAYKKDDMKEKREKALGRDGANEAQEEEEVEEKGDTSDDVVQKIHTLSVRKKSSSGYDNFIKFVLPIR